MRAAIFMGFVCLMFASACKRPSIFFISEYEGRLAPIASALSWTSDADLRAVGVDFPLNGTEFEISPSQAINVLQRIHQRMKLQDGIPADLKYLSRLRYFLRRVNDPTAERLHMKGGIQRPFTVTIYETGPKGELDKKRCFSD